MAIYNPTNDSEYVFNVEIVVYLNYLKGRLPSKRGINKVTLERVQEKSTAPQLDLFCL